VYGHVIRRTICALYAHDLTSRSARRIGHILSANWMQTHSSGCEFLCPTDFGIGMLMVPTGMGVLTPAGNGLYLPSHKQTPKGRTPANSSLFVESSVALTAEFDHVLWHRRFGHLDMQSL
jgi:hypothetical protein